MLGEIEAWVSEQDDSSIHTNDDGPLRALAGRSAVPVDTLGSWFKPSGGVQSIAFDIADKLFCVMGRQHLWRERYSDYYYGVNLDTPTRAICEHGVEYTWGENKVDACARCRAIADVRNRNRCLRRAAA